MAAVSLALVNGRIRTGDVRRPLADAVAIDGALLVLVGSSAEVRKLAGAGARVVDLRGAAVRPIPTDAVLRRGEAASLVVIGDDARELLRLHDGDVVLDLFA